MSKINNKKQIKTIFLIRRISILKKKLFLTLLTFFMVLTLISCKWGKIHQINYFLEGEFIGFEANNSEIEFYLNIIPITNEEYINSNGVNVVHDAYKDLYYELKLFFLVDDNEEKRIIFENLKAYGTPYRYGDDAGNIIKPMISKNNPLTDESEIYIVEINYKDDIEFYSNDFYIHFKYKEEIK